MSTTREQVLAKVAAMDIEEKLALLTRSVRLMADHTSGAEAALSRNDWLDINDKLFSVEILAEMLTAMVIEVKKTTQVTRDNAAYHPYLNS